MEVWKDILHSWSWDRDFVGVGDGGLRVGGGGGGREKKERMEVAS